MNDTDISRALLGLTAQIVSSHLKKNPVPAAELPALIRQVHAALAGAGTPVVAEPEQPPAQVMPKRSIFTDYIICLEDGRKLKTLKRHLRATYNMSPDEYREKWGLPADYPMVAPSYAARRSSLAKSLGLGRKAAQADAPESPPISMQEQEPLPTEMPRFTIAPAAATPPVTTAPPPPPREPRGPEPTLESVFGKFSRPSQAAAPIEMAPAPAPAANDAPESSAKKAQRKPFSKQLARTMRP
jgi:predicted transcriptional regulator